MITFQVANQIQTHITEKSLGHYSKEWWCSVSTTTRIIKSKKETKPKQHDLNIHPYKKKNIDKRADQAIGCYISVLDRAME